MSCKSLTVDTFLYRDDQFKTVQDLSFIFGKISLLCDEAPYNFDESCLALRECYDLLCNFTNFSCSLLKEDEEMEAIFTRFINMKIHKIVNKLILESFLKSCIVEKWSEDISDDAMLCFQSLTTYLLHLEDVITNNTNSRSANNIHKANGINGFDITKNNIKSLNNSYVNSNFGVTDVINRMTGVNFNTVIQSNSKTFTFPVNLLLNILAKLDIIESQHIHNYDKYKRCLSALLMAHVHKPEVLLYLCELIVSCDCTFKRTNKVISAIEYTSKWFQQVIRNPVLIGQKSIIEQLEEAKINLLALNESVDKYVVLLILWIDKLLLCLQYFGDIHPNVATPILSSFELTEDQTTIPKQNIHYYNNNTTVRRPSGNISIQKSKFVPREFQIVGRSNSVREVFKEIADESTESPLKEEFLSVSNINDGSSVEWENEFKLSPKTMADTNAVEYSKESSFISFEGKKNGLASKYKGLLEMKTRAHSNFKLIVTNEISEETKKPIKKYVSNLNEKEVLNRAAVDSVEGVKIPNENKSNTAQIKQTSSVPLSEQKKSFRQKIRKVWDHAKKIMSFFKCKRNTERRNRNKCYYLVPLLECYNGLQLYTCWQQRRVRNRISKCFFHHHTWHMSIAKIKRFV